MDNRLLIARGEETDAAVGRLISSQRAATRVVIALAVIVLGAGAFVWLRATPRAGAHKGGDPGGRLMARLAPLVKVVPGFEDGRVRWISPPCDSCRFPAMYAMKVEPRWDSCDGRPGTFGWDPVVIQVGFRWAGTTRALVRLLGGRLAARGWAAGAPRPGVTGALTPGSSREPVRPRRRSLSSLQEMGGKS